MARWAARLGETRSTSMGWPFAALKTNVLTSLACSCPLTSVSVAPTGSVRRVGTAVGLGATVGATVEVGRTAVGGGAVGGTGVGGTAVGGTGVGGTAVAVDGSTVTPTGG